MSQPDKQSFAAHVGATFRARVSGDTDVTLVLAEVSRAGETPERPFALVFEARDGAALGQRTYAVSHETLGTFELFLVPIGPAPATRAPQYEAVFN
jgi:hypothetical protein